MYITVCWWNT